MSFTLILGTLKMDSFFVSDELKGILTPDSLSVKKNLFPEILIDKKPYQVISLKENEFEKVSIRFFIDHCFLVKKKIYVQNLNFFGRNISELNTDFVSIEFDVNHNKYICDIRIDKNKLWE